MLRKLKILNLLQAKPPQHQFIQVTITHIPNFFGILFYAHIK
jgi:hypothetical protein